MLNIQFPKPSEHFLILSEVLRAFFVNSVVKKRRLKCPNAAMLKYPIINAKYPVPKPL